jgi:hypothetical protein
MLILEECRLAVSKGDSFGLVCVNVGKNKIDD